MCVLLTSEQQAVVSSIGINKANRLADRKTCVLQNDPYRLRILLPLLELLHHYCINQHSIQHAAEFIGDKFAGCLFQPANQSWVSYETTALAVAASTAMVLEYRTLFGQSMVDLDNKAAHKRAVSHAVDIPQSQHSTAVAMSCPMPTSPMAAKRLPSSGLHFDMESEPEDFERSPKTSYFSTSLFGSPVSDDMDSAFSGSSIEMEDSKTSVESEDIDADLAHAVDSLCLESTSDLLFTNKVLGSAYGRSSRPGVMSY